MTQVDLISLEDANAWDEALFGIPHSFHHTRSFVRAMHMTTGYRTFLLSLRDGQRRLVCALVERDMGGYLDVATPSGLSGFTGTADWSEVSEGWHDFARERGYVCAYVGLHPLFAPTDLQEGAPSHNSIYVLDLTLGREGLRRRMDQNRRRELRGWEERSEEFVRDPEVLAEFLASKHAIFMKEVGARPPHLTPEALKLLCHTPNCLVVGTAAPEGVEAVYLFGETPYAGECLINVATSEGRRHTTDLVWFGASWLAERGVPVLSLGGGASEDDAVAKAKQRFGPRRLPLRSMQRVYRPDVYADLCSLAGVEPADGGYFPAFRTPETATPGVDTA